MEISIRIKSLRLSLLGNDKNNKNHTIQSVLWSITLAHTLSLTEFVQARATRNTPFSSDYKVFSSFFFFWGGGVAGGRFRGRGGSVSHPQDFMLYVTGLELRKKGNITAWLIHSSEPVSSLAPK